MCGCGCACVHVPVRACVHTCACALRILSMDRIFHFTNTFIIIITCQPCASILLQTTALTETRKVDKVHLSSFFCVLFLCLLNEKDVFTETVCMFCVVYNLRYFHFFCFCGFMGLSHTGSRTTPEHVLQSCPLYKAARTQHW